MIERMQGRRSEEGFTLIELLIVIVILAILAAVVIFAVGGITDRGKKSACKTDLKTVETASEAYYAKYSQYAGSMGVLVTEKLLRETPNSAAYSITYNSSTG